MGRQPLWHRVGRLRLQRRRQSARDRQYPQPSFKLDHFEGTSGTYAGLDRFGSVVDQYWAGFSGIADVDRIHYAYDYVGNRTYRQIDPTIYPTENMDQAYTYDGLHRLLTSQVGKLSGTTITGTPASEEDWTLDGLGNWPGYVQKASGNVSLNQTRTASPANEISAISATVGITWATPAYDLAGNMTSVPTPTNLASAYTAVYDAWNRLVSLANGSTTVATYAYDGLNRRIVKGIYVGGTLDHNEHAYFNENWQLLEVRKEVSGTINSNPLEQYVWHPFYIDASVSRDYDATCSGSPTRYYYAFDANFNVTAVTTSTGAPLERYQYSPCGSLTFLDGSFHVLGTQASQIGNTVTYTGRQYDPETGLIYLRSRYLHARIGTFTSRDPVTYSDSLTLYSYALSNPLIYADPMGEAGFSCVKVALNSNIRAINVQTTGFCAGQDVDVIVNDYIKSFIPNIGLTQVQDCYPGFKCCPILKLSITIRVRPRPVKIPVLTCNVSFTVQGQATLIVIAGVCVPPSCPCPPPLPPLNYEFTF
ncbi:MAG TPA: RHS repeat-associated core domain-containing protein [Planctomycetaceae bacterium]|nr:RHS repeat-associated core domain-containing protein [Planctomycetaceae bacterium]